MYKACVEFISSEQKGGIIGANGIPPEGSMLGDQCSVMDMFPFAHSPKLKLY
jgi:hypothetical protein